MALHVQLVSDLGIVLDLDASPYGMNAGGGTLGSVDLGSQYTNVWQRGWRPLVSQNVGNREIELSIQMRGVSHDDLQTNYRQLTQTIAEAASYHVSGGKQGAAAHLAVQLPGATNTTVYEVVSGEVPQVPVFSHSVQSTTAPYMLSCPVRLMLKPWGRPQALTRATAVVEGWGGNSSLVAPNTQVLSITPTSNMTRESPVLLTFTHTSGASDMDFGDNAGVIIARRSKGNVANWTPVLQAEIGTASNYQVTSGAFTSCAIGTTANTSAQGGAYLQVQSSAITGAGGVSGVIATWELTKNISDMAGLHRIYVNCDSNGAGARWSSMQWSYGGSSGDAVMLDSASWEVAGRAHSYGGIINIPDDPSLNSFKMRLRSKLTSGGAAVLKIDSITLVPIDEQYFNATMTGANAVWASQQMRIDGLSPVPSVYALDSSGNQPTTLTFGVLAQPPYGFTVPPRPTKFIALAGSSNSSKEFTITADYYPYTDFLL